MAPPARGARRPAARLLVGLTAGLLAASVPFAAALGQSATAAPASPGATREPPFHFTREAGRALAALWQSSIAVHEERVGCLAADVRDGAVLVTRVLPLRPDGADSMGIASDASIARCGPPEWRGTVHTHVAEYTGGRPSGKFSAQDRGVMQRWYDRWHADAVFCLVYSAEDAHCEADGVVGGMRVRPRGLGAGE